ncbi:MAG: hypothetical protein J0H55_14285 [Chitinophagaceae bacterium]|nr:hypothetical protein [Chitinophagaceae bacterium]
MIRKGTSESIITASLVKNLCLFILVITTNALPGFSQQNDMLIEQIAGRQIIRENFDKGGKLAGRQIFKVGQLIKKPDAHSIEIEVELYDKALKPEDKYVTTYVCKPAQSDVLVNVFPFAARNKKKISIKITSGEFKNLYAVSQGKFAQTISIIMTIESGVLNFLGSKNKVTIDGRSKTENDTGMIINSSITIQAYLLGIKFKTIKYKITEYLNKNGFLNKQVLNNSDGSYFVMNY